MTEVLEVAGRLAWLDRPKRALDAANTMVERAFRPAWRAALIIVILTALIRANVMGDPNYHVDEPFYLLVAERMHAGATLYVDIWDRKPPGIYLVNYVISALWPGMFAVHVAAAISVAVGAVLLFRIARLLCGPRGSALAAIGYVAILGRFGGAGAQTPVFYNTLMIAAVWLVVSRFAALAQGRMPAAIPLAMLAAGAAITIKPVALAEAVFVGLAVVWVARKVVPPRRLAVRALGLMLAGAAPMLACFAWYWADGHFADMWDSIVLSNFRRNYLVAESQRVLLILMAQLGLVFGLAFLSAWFGRDRLRSDIQFKFVVGWLGVAVLAFLAFPNKADHYILPVAAPLMACAAPFLDRRDFGLAVGTYLVAIMLATGETFTFTDRIESRREIAQVSAYIRQHDRSPRLFVYVGPPTLYSTVHAAPLSPLAFPPHLYCLSERNVSEFSTWREFETILSRHPTTIVWQNPVPALDEDVAMTARLKTYIAAHCRTGRTMPVRDMYGPYRIRIETECGDMSAPVT